MGGNDINLGEVLKLVEIKHADPKKYEALLEDMTAVIRDLMKISMKIGEEAFKEISGDEKENI